MVKVAAVLLLFVVGATVADQRPRLGRRPPGRHRRRASRPSELGFAVLLGALAFAGAGGGQNLVQSNWIRDKGFGMGAYVPRITSPVTGEPEAAPSTGLHLRADAARTSSAGASWWRFANIEQLVTFVLITVRHDLLHLAARLLDRVRRARGLPDDIGFLEVEGTRSRTRVGAVVRHLLLGHRRVRLFAAALGIVDYTCRLVADVHQDQLRAGREREQALLRPGLGDRRHRDRRAADRHRPAARADRDLRRASAA